MLIYYGLFKYPAIIFWPLTDPLPPPMIKCDHLAIPPPSPKNDRVIFEQDSYVKIDSRDITVNHKLGLF